MSTEQETLEKTLPFDEEIIENTPASWLGIGAVLAAIGASVCCVGPLLLVSLGIGGAWMSAFTSMETVRPYLIILTLIFIGLGYRKLFFVPDSCKEGEASATAPCVALPPASMQSCALPEVKHKQRMIFWIGSALILLLLTFPWYAPFFME
jgi:mercuric ion transport protein